MKTLEDKCSSLLQAVKDAEDKATSLAEEQVLKFKGFEEYKKQIYEEA